MKIHCCACDKKVDARLADGSEIYPHRTDLASLPFWKCDGCGNFVGCHYKSSVPSKPLGVIPTPEIKALRKRIHEVLDPLWQQGLAKRTELYKAMSDKMGFKYHTANLRTLDDANKALSVVIALKEFYST